MHGRGVMEIDSPIRKGFFTFFTNRNFLAKKVGNQKNFFETLKIEMFVSKLIIILKISKIFG